MKTAKLRLINPKPTLISPHIQARRRSGTHTQSPEGGQERGMFRRLLPVRMFNKPRALGFILFHKSEHDSAAFCASLTHRPEQHETRSPPAFQTFLHHFLSHRSSEPTHSHSHSIGMCPPSCHLPHPGEPLPAPRPTANFPRASAGAPMESCPASQGFQGSQPGPALSCPRPRSVAPEGDTPRSSRHAGQQELKLGREAN